MFFEGNSLSNDGNENGLILAVLLTEKTIHSCILRSLALCSERGSRGKATSATLSLLLLDIGLKLEPDGAFEVKQEPFGHR